MKAKNQKPNNQKKIKIRYGRIFIFLCVFVLTCFLCFFIYQAPIKNIFIDGNTLLTDQEIIDLAGIREYPSNFKNLSFQIKKRLEENTYIKAARIKKNFLGAVFIQVEENYPLFFYNPNNKTILLDGTEVSATFAVPFVMNYIPNTKYNQFISKMQTVSKDIISRISEIKYDPNEVDDGRFLLSMRDGNYVYLTLTRFTLIDRYLEIISKEEFIGKKGILKLDAGNSFEILEG